MKTIEDVLDQPSLKRLQKDYAERKTGRGLVFFVGSGLSSSAGLPDWSSLAEKLSRECKHVLEVNQISHSQLGPLYARLVSEPILWKKFSLIKEIKFSLIKEILGQTSFPAAVKTLLSTDDIKVPRSYDLISSMDVAGFISLNIDRFLIKAINIAITDPIYPVYGKDAAGRLHELTRNRPFLYQPHGLITSESSWVFTEEDFEELCQSPLHDEFLTSIFLRDTVVFIGISADDAGASLRLAKLNERGLGSQSHYWITTTSHIEKRDWAEKSGIQQILYPASLGHDFCISKIITSIKEYTSFDLVLNNPVTGFIEKEKDNITISPSELFKLDDIDRIRIILNKIIENSAENGEISYENYSKICKNYARAIHSSYMMPTGEGEERWFGYKISGKSLGGKTIGRVMPALNKDNEPVAIKILDQRRYSNELYLSAFRRGIKALKILANRGVEGTVNVRDAYELPPTIVMNYLNCASLEDSVVSGKLSSLNALRAMRSAAQTILQAHLLPEIVLHRDIRPSNILLEGFDWVDGSFESVKVIDFDLGWHSGALGDDFIRSDRDTLGFQAPEQLQHSDSARRRTTLIDSFGLGATLYFCMANKSPELGYDRDPKWPKAVRDSFSRRFRENPEVCRFLSELVQSAMHDNANSRISVSEIRERLKDAIHWIENNSEKCSSDFIAEIIYSISSSYDYECDVRRKMFTYSTLSGLDVDISHDFLDNQFKINFSYSKPGNVDNSRADKVISLLQRDFTSFFSSIELIRNSFAFTGSREFSARVAISPSYVMAHPWEIATCVKVFSQKLNIQ